MKKEICYVKRNTILQLANLALNELLSEDNKAIRRSFYLECKKELNDWSYEVHKDAPDYCPNWKKGFTGFENCCYGTISQTCDCGCDEGKERCNGINHKGD